MIPITRNITRNIVRFCLVIMAAKKLHYNKLLLKSNNKPKAISNTVKTITNNKNTINTTSTMKY